MYLPSVAKQYLGWTSNLYIQTDPGCSPAGYTGSATVTSNQPIVMIVNHTNASRVCFESPTGGDWSASFNAVPFFTGP